MANVLAVLEQRDGAIKTVSYEVLGAAQQLATLMGGEPHALIIGPPSLAPGADVPAARTFLAASDDLALYQADPYSAIAAGHAKERGYAVVMLAATALGLDLGPRIAARLDCALATDVTGLAYQGAVRVKRPAYSGKAIYTLEVTASPCVVSVRPNVFAAPAGAGGGELERVDVQAMTEAGGGAKAGAVRRSTTVEVKHPQKDRPDVAEASIIVSGGRGMKGAEHFHLIEELADALGAAVGASRAVVDAGWRPHAEQVGQTGKTVSPTLYIAIGISGAVQHLAGMRTAKTIVAINKDKDAPIFKVADYGIVGDAFEVVPKLTEAIRALKAG